MRIAPILSVIAVTAAPLPAQVATSPRARHVAADIRVLADDSLAGRKTCQPGNQAAAIWLAHQLREAGVRPLGDSSSYMEAWTVGNTSGTREAGIAGCRTANVV